MQGIALKIRNVYYIVIQSRLSEFETLTDAKNVKFNKKDNHFVSWSVNIKLQMNM